MNDTVAHRPVLRKRPFRPRGSRGPTSLSSWALAIAKALQSRGCDAAAIFAMAGLDFAALADPEARLPVRSPSRLWPLAVEATGDRCFGLEVARHATPTTFHALGFSLAASASLREAFERLVRYYRLVSDAIAIDLEEFDHTYRVSVRSERAIERGTAGAAPPAPSPDPAYEAIDAIFALGVRLCRSLTNREFSPLLVEMRRPPPANPTPFHECFRAPVTFGAAHNAMTFDKAVCDRRLPGANPGLARANDLIAAQALERWDHSFMADRILDRTRRELAEAYLHEARYSVAEIAYMLGFARTSSLTRAFRRWNGCAPSEFRKEDPRTAPAAAGRARGAAHPRGR